MKVVEKEWGKEYWIEVNKNYTMKKLVIKAGYSTSLQYHREKTETLYVSKGTGLITIEDKFKVANEGDYAHVQAGVVHKITAVTDLEIIEASTSELEDVVRLD